MKYFWLILLPCLAFGQMSKKSESSVVTLYDKKVAKTHARYLTVEVGDSVKTKFDPSFKISAWDGECEFRLHLSTTDKPLGLATRSLAAMNGKDKTTLTTVDVTHGMYVRQDGNFEWETIFPSKPDANVFTYQIETKGLNFHYQPKLTQEEIADGTSRPDSVIGSYAVYHNSKANNQVIIDGKDTTFENYKTGKAFHIYRPKVWDASGDTIWGFIDIDTVLGCMTIGTDSTWMANAVYPVTRDPVFGLGTEGASGRGLNGAQNLFSEVGTGPASNGTLTSVGIWIADGAAAESCLVVLYSEQPTPFNLVATSDIFLVANAASTEYTGISISGSVVADVNYTIMVTSQSAITLQADLDGGATWDNWKTQSGSAWPVPDDPISPDFKASDHYQFSVEFTYTTGGEPPTGQVIIIQ